MVLQAKSFGIFPAALAAALFLTSCAHPPATFRLTAPAGTAVLLPPGSRENSSAKVSVAAAGATRKVKAGVCPRSGHGLIIDHPGRSNARVIVSREALTATSGSELFAWTTELEKQGCIPANEAFRVAENIVDSVPLYLAKRRELLQGRTDLRPGNSLNVISPVMKPGSGFGPTTVTSVRPGATEGNIVMEVKSDPTLIGYEVDWYDVLPKDSGAGYRIVPRSAETHVNGEVEHPASPTTPRFGADPDARWFELFMMTKVSANDFDFVVFSARTPEELRKRDADFQRDAATFLKTVDPRSYTVLPHGTGINALIRVLVNGLTKDLPRGKTVREAIAQAGGDPQAVLARLKIRKLHDGRLFPVEWARGTDLILALPLEGGEEISW
jgi:hypothetical protein